MGRQGVDIASLTPEERLWDSLVVTPEAVLLTEAQRAELDRRLDDLDLAGPLGIPWEDVLNRIRSRRR